MGSNARCYNSLRRPGTLSVSTSIRILAPRVAAVVLMLLSVEVRLELVWLSSCWRVGSLVVVLLSIVKVLVFVLRTEVGVYVYTNVNICAWLVWRCRLPIVHLVVVLVILTSSWLAVSLAFVFPGLLHLLPRPHQLLPLLPTVLTSSQSPFAWLVRVATQLGVLLHQSVVDLNAKVIRVLEPLNVHLQLLNEL